jgi:hypothetical protein
MAANWPWITEAGIFHHFILKSFQTALVINSGCNQLFSEINHSIGIRQHIRPKKE